MTVTVAADGPDALALAARQPFDLVLLDVEMPGLSGLEVLTELRGSYSQTDLPIIMVTARTSGDDVVEAFRLGANDYVTKPIDFAVALARIGTHLGHKRAVEKLRESEERYALAVHGANDGLWDWNLRTNEVHWSPRWKSLLGFADSEIGTGPDEWFSRVHHEDVDRVREALARHLHGGDGHYESEHRILHRSGTYRWVRCRGAAIRDAAGAATRLAGSLTDITDTKVADALTGLPNRLLFVDLLDRAIKRSERRRDYRFALLALGLDRFQTVNDSLGLETADRLLVAVARRLQASLRSTDVITGPRVHAGAPRRRRVHRAARRHRRRQRRVQGGRAAAPRAAAAVRRRRAAGLHVREHRHRGQHHRLRHAGRHPPRCGDGAAPGQGRRQHAVRVVRCRDAPARDLAARGRDRSPPRRREPRLRGVLPADRVARHRVDRRLRGARPLAPSARPGQPGRVHSDRRGHRDDPADRAHGARGVVPSARPLAASVRRPRPARRLRQRVEPAVRRCRSRRPHRAHPCRRAAEVVEPQAGDHRERVPRRPAGGAGDARAACARSASSAASTTSAPAIRR